MKVKNLLANSVLILATSLYPNMGYSNNKNKAEIGQTFHIKESFPKKLKDLETVTGHEFRKQFIKHFEGSHFERLRNELGSTQRLTELRLISQKIGAKLEHVRSPIAWLLFNSIDLASYLATDPKQILKKTSEAAIFGVAKDILDDPEAFTKDLARGYINESVRYLEEYVGLTKRSRGYELSYIAVLDYMRFSYLQQRGNIASDTLKEIEKKYEQNPDVAMQKAALDRLKEVEGDFDSRYGDERQSDSEKNEILVSKIKEIMESKKGLMEYKPLKYMLNRFKEHDAEYAEFLERYIGEANSQLEQKIEEFSYGSQFILRYNGSLELMPLTEHNQTSAVVSNILGKIKNHKDVKVSPDGKKMFISKDDKAYLVYAQINQSPKEFIFDMNRVGEWVGNELCFSADDGFYMLNASNSSVKKISDLKGLIFGCYDGKAYYFGQDQGLAAVKYYDLLNNIGGVWLNTFRHLEEFSFNFDMNDEFIAVNYLGNERFAAIATHEQKNKYSTLCKSCVLVELDNSGDKAAYYRLIRNEGRYALEVRDIKEQKLISKFDLGRFVSKRASERGNIDLILDPNAKLMMMHDNAGQRIFWSSDDKMIFFYDINSDNGFVYDVPNNSLIKEVENPGRVYGFVEVK